MTSCSLRAARIQGPTLMPHICITCMYASMHLCIDASTAVCIYASMHLCIHTFMYLCMHASIHLCIYLSIHLSIYLSIYLCIYLQNVSRPCKVRPNILVYVYICVYIYIYIFSGHPCMPSSCILIVGVKLSPEKILETGNRFACEMKENR